MELYLKEGPVERPNKKASSWGADESNLRRHVIPLLGRHPAKSLKPSDIAKFQADIAAGKSKSDVKTVLRGRSITRGGKGTAARTVGTLSAMFNFAVARKLVPDNPARGVKLFKREPKERFLTGLPRTSEWVLPAARGLGPVSGLQKAWMAVRERAGFPGLRMHDLRHSFASFAVADGASLFLIGKVLGHKQARTTEIYAHVRDDPLRAIADRSANRIDEAWHGRSR